MRPDWDDYFMSMAYLVATRGTCDRKKVGSVIVKDLRVISTGYNGAPSGMPDCDRVGHELKEIDGRQSCVRTLHAESNAIDRVGREAKDAVLYTNVIPCYDCAKRIIGVGIKRVLYAEYYKSRNTDLVEAYFEKSASLGSFGCHLEKWNGELILPTAVPDEIIQRTANIQRNRIEGQ